MKEDQTWRDLLAQSGHTFAGETEPPFGFATRLLAAVREERRQQAALERMGWRAILASLAMVVVAGALTAGLQIAGDPEDPEPGVKSMALVENVQVS
jgi:hypothetical protein